MVKSKLYYCKDVVKRHLREIKDKIRLSKNEMETQADIIAWYVAHNKRRITAVRSELGEIDKCCLSNLLKTPKHSFLYSLGTSI